MKGVPADVGEHGAAYDERGDDEGGKDTGPEAHAAKRYEQDAVFSSEVDPRLIRQEGLHSYCNQKARRPHQGDSE